MFRHLKHVLTWTDNVLNSEVTELALEQRLGPTCKTKQLLRYTNSVVR